MLHATPTIEEFGKEGKHSLCRGVVKAKGRRDEVSCGAMDQVTDAMMLSVRGSPHPGASAGPQIPSDWAPSKSAGINVQLINRPVANTLVGVAPERLNACLSTNFYPLEAGVHHIQGRGEGRPKASYMTWRQLALDLEISAKYPEFGATATVTLFAPRSPIMEGNEGKFAHQQLLFLAAAASATVPQRYSGNLVTGPTGLVLVGGLGDQAEIFAYLNTTGSVDPGEQQLPSNPARRCARRRDTDDVNAAAPQIAHNVVVASYSLSSNRSESVPVANPFGPGWSPMSSYSQTCVNISTTMYCLDIPKSAAPAAPLPGKQASGPVISAFDLVKLQWSPTLFHVDIPTRSRHSMVAIGKSAYIFGGEHNAVGIREWAQMMQKTFHSSNRYRRAAGVSSDLLVSDHQATPLGDLYRLDFSNTTVVVTPLVNATGTAPSPRLTHCATTLGIDGMLVHGGTSQSTLFGDTFVYNGAVSGV
ncbi:hypothetical protein BDK51DRAFT_42557 [Blyttiomyces helicus]|uniref:Uncharacterized protein n=1 Tax=Blyttiomyces helicus TaxID=388810 RepID=A0A4P9W3K4_9FUNG|nr:hypothetical protein BDK51DRAFT_42557 [Blyttiomyces helicus]|eukprot:RKO86901.1 hypothetical protein BDK51DRAFT_42557 [Blyttiomyces helicus]